MPARNALLGDGNASIRAAYFQPLLRFLERADDPLGRVEVVPTALHWEAAYVAPVFPAGARLGAPARHRRQPDLLHPGRADGEHLSRLAVRQRRAVRCAARRAARLRRAGRGASGAPGVPGLRAVWHNAHWRVYAVVGAPGLVSGPARLLSSSGAELQLLVARAGSDRRARALRRRLGCGERARCARPIARRLARAAHAARRPSRAACRHLSVAGGARRTAYGAGTSGIPPAPRDLRMRRFSPDSEWTTNIPRQR